VKKIVAAGRILLSQSSTDGKLYTLRQKLPETPCKNPHTSVLQNKNPPGLAQEYITTGLHRVIFTEEHKVKTPELALISLYNKLRETPCPNSFRLCGKDFVPKPAVFLFFTTESICKRFRCSGSPIDGCKEEIC